MEAQRSRQNAKENQGQLACSHNKKKTVEEKSKECHSIGFTFSQLLQETVIEVIYNLHTNQRQAQLMLRKQLKKIESFDIKQISFKECHGYYLLSKIYYLEEKCKELKISFAKVSKQKSQLLQKVKGGLRKYDHIEQMYSIFADKQRSSESFKQKEGKCVPSH